MLEGRERCLIDIKQRIALNSKFRLLRPFFSDSFSILVRLHAKEKQKASGWTGFNISVCNEFQVLHYVIGYSRWWCGRSERNGR